MGHFAEDPGKPWPPGATPGIVQAVGAFPARPGQ